MAPNHSSNLSDFFADPVVNLVLKNPVPRAWILNDMPDPLPSLKVDDLNHAFINCASIRPSPNTYRLLAMHMENTLNKGPLGHDSNTHENQNVNDQQNNTTLPKISDPLPGPSPYADYFASVFQKGPGTSLYTVSHIVDGFGLGNIYECAHDRHAFQRQVLSPLNDDQDGKPILRKFVLVLDADELLILQIARYENGPVLFQSHRTHYNHSSYSLHYYLFDRLPHFTEFHAQNSPLRILTYDAFSANLIMKAMVTQKRQCPPCALSKSVCSCPDHLRNSFFPSMSGTQFSLQNFLNKYEVFKNASFFSTVVLQTAKKFVYLESFLDVAASCGSVKTYDFARDVYCRFYMSPKTIPRILNGIGSNISSYLLHQEDITQSNILEPSQDEKNIENDQATHSVSLLQQNDIENILENPVKFFIRLRISGERSTKQVQRNVITHIKEDEDEPQNEAQYHQPHLLSHLENMESKDSIESSTAQVKSGPLSMSSVTLTKDINSQTLGSPTMTTRELDQQLPSGSTQEISPLDHVGFDSTQLVRQQDWFAVNMVDVFCNDFESDSNPHLIDFDSIFCFPEASVTEQLNSQEIATKLLSQRQDQTKLDVKDSIHQISCETTKKDEKTVSLLEDRKCKICGRILNRPADLKRHFKTVHEKERLFNCEDCDAGFQLRWHLNEHKRVVHGGDKPFTCGVCSLSFARRGDINKHIKVVHEKIRNFSCTECDMKFFQRSDLKRHITKKHLASQKKILA